MRKRHKNIDSEHFCYKSKIPRYTIFWTYSISYIFLQVVHDMNRVISSKSDSRHLWWINSTWNSYPTLTSEGSIVYFDFNTSLSDKSTMRKPMCRLGKTYK